MPNPKTEEDYQKESDARTLAEAEVIKADARRLAGAKEAAANMVSTMEKVAEGTPPVRTAKYGEGDGLSS